MKIGVYGGSYNPPHLGHVRAAESAVSALQLDRLLVVPCARPPHKQLAIGSPTEEQRLVMTKLAFTDVEAVEVSDSELQRGGVSYTVDTLEQLRSQFPGDELYLLMGTDMLLSFGSWKNFEKIFTLCTLAVFIRGAGEKASILEAAESLQSRYGASIVYIENNAVEISSSAIRESLPRRGSREFLPDSVYAYIVQHRLYQAKPDFAWLREKAYAMLKPSRIPHVAGCEQEAVKLAERWGEDPEEARTAGILHDITKKMDLSQQLKLCEKYDILLDSLEKEEGKLLHSKTGAAVARDIFGVSPEVFSAIYWHTTGHANMTMLEKIIYMADYMEPNRRFDGVDALRKLAYTDMNQALLLGYKMSMEDLKRRHIIPHPRTVEALEDLRKGLKETNE